MKPAMVAPMFGIMSRRPAITPRPERVARAEQPGGQALRGAGDHGDDDDADRPAGNGLRDPVPYAEPALVVARHEDAGQRLPHLADVDQQEQADEEDREAGQEDAEEVSGDAEDGADRVRHRGGDRVRPVLDVLGGAAVAEEVELVGVAQI